jgi:hypothetical protein
LTIVWKATKCTNHFVANELRWKMKYLVWEDEFTWRTNKRFCESADAFANMPLVSKNTATSCTMIDDTLDRCVSLTQIDHAMMFYVLTADIRKIIAHSNIWSVVDLKTRNICSCHNSSPHGECKAKMSIIDLNDLVGNQSTSV